MFSQNENTNESTADVSAQDVNGKKKKKKKRNSEVDGSLVAEIKDESNACETPIKEEKIPVSQ